MHANEKRFHEQKTTIGGHTQPTEKNPAMSAAAAGEPLQLWEDRTTGVRRLSLYLRGAGVLAFFFPGLWRAVLDAAEEHQQRLGEPSAFAPGNWHLRGSSSGALMATLMACNLPLPLEMLVQIFDREVHKLKQKMRHAVLHKLAAGGSTRTTFSPMMWLRYAQMLLWLEPRCRYYLVPCLLRAYLTDDMVRQRCNHHLTIVCFSVTDMALVTRSQWDNREELIQWVCASMAIPGVTSFPRRVGKLLLMDAFALDKYWPRSFESDPHRKLRTEIQASPWASSVTAHAHASVNPTEKYSSLDALSTPSATRRKELYDAGKKAMARCLHQLSQTVFAQPPRQGVVV